jgi:hypothetical protein
LSLTVISSRGTGHAIARVGSKRFTFTYVAFADQWSSTR